MHPVPSPLTHLAGTIVYEGVLDSRPVAVKRLLRQFYTLARKEIQVLVVSDEHPNVVRCFAMEEDREFVYLALERCKHSLSDTLSSREGQQDMQVRPDGQWQQ
jgi:serine/threonine-protein kinase/endoribonuclease IRE1